MSSSSSVPTKGKPVTVVRGSCRVKIYVSTTTAKGHTYDQFAVVYHELSGKRVKRNCGDWVTARKLAEDTATQLANGQVEAVKLTNADRANYLQALDLLKPYGVSLNIAVAQYAEALAKLPPGTSLIEAVADFARRNQSAAPTKTVSEVVAEFIADRREHGCSDVHLRDLEDRLERFAGAFQAPISQVTRAMLREYLMNLTDAKKVALKKRTRRNHQRIITSLFHFARRQRYITADHLDDIAEMEMPKAEVVKTGIFTPEEIRSILEAAPRDILPILAIGAFAGLRTAELSRITWDNVKLSERCIEIDQKDAKTKTRRLAPITENLALWLADYSGATGLVSPAPTDRAMNHRMVRTAAKAGVKWVDNGLRHSFCSYRLATEHDVNRVAKEAGNSAIMIERHYKALVTEAQGKAWFAVKPVPGQAKILPLPVAA